MSDICYKIRFSLIRFKVNEKWPLYKFSNVNEVSAAYYLKRDDKEISNLISYID